MRRSSIVNVFALLLLAVGPSVASAQMRRSGGPGGPAPAGDPPKATPRDARHPYAGVWDGSFTIRGGPGGEHTIPLTMVVSATDSGAKGYSAATILPNGARAPHFETRVVNGEMQWKQENSGGGFWVYAGKLVGRDSVAGTVALKDWPQLPAGEKPPAGTFGLVRRRP